MGLFKSRRHRLVGLEFLKNLRRTKLEKKDWENIGAGIITFLNLVNNEVKPLEDCGFKMD